MAEAWYLKKLRELEKKLKEVLDELATEKAERKKDKEKIKDLERQLHEMAAAKEAKRPKFPDYSVSKQEHGSKRKYPRGRIPFAEKLKTVQFVKDMYPENIPSDQCARVSRRIVTHLKEGKKEIWLYNIYRKKWGMDRGKLPEVFGKSEYGIEVVVVLAFLVYFLKLSHDQAKQVLGFFCGIKIEKAEINYLFNILGKAWEKEFNAIADLILLSTLVHIDETGWKIGKENCYTWIFKTLSHTLLLYGEKRNEAVLDRILPRGKFKGTAISDCYKIYENYFSSAQKCWAHFLRKAIKLMLLYTEKKEYEDFFKELHAIFVEGKKLKEQEGDKEEKIAAFEERITKICTEKDRKLDQNTTKDVREYVNLHKNLTRNLKDLFTFIRIKEVEPTNNCAEQGFRREIGRAHV